MMILSGKQNKSENITWHHSQVTREDREKRLGQKGGVVWLTGYSGAGKSTIAMALEKALFDSGVYAFVLDGDNLRHGLNANLGFSPEDRSENIRRVGEAAKLFSEAGWISITAFISPYESDRAQVRKRIGDCFIEVHLSCSLEVCEARDPKGLYKKARQGQIQDFTGVSAPYEIPRHPEITVDTENQNLEQCVGQIIFYLVQQGFVKALNYHPSM